MLKRLKLIADWTLLHFSSNRSLASKVERAICSPGLIFTPSFSGRDALLHVAQYLVDQTAGFQTGRRTAVLPDYICNVVFKAIEQAGLEVVTIKTDGNFSVSKVDFLHALNEPSTSFVLVASIYGSDAALPLLNDPDVKKTVLDRRTPIIVDLCQDISLARQLPTEYGDLLWAITSFNDKSFLGAMGGGIIGFKAIPLSRSINLEQSLRLYVALFRKLVRILLAQVLSRFKVDSSKVSSRFEYSKCNTFPYDISNRCATKLQLVMGLLGVRALPMLLIRRERFFLDTPGVIALPNASTSPFLAFASSNVSVNRKRKRPYAIHGHSKTSLMPDLIVLHNKGFDDE